MKSEAANCVDFSQIRYGQCWEDADIVLEAMNVKPGDTCLSISSAGDNTLALLTRSPERVIALDLSAAQLACLELRAAAYKELSHAQLLNLIGVTADCDRLNLYRKCRPHLSEPVRHFWDANTVAILRGIGNSGKFEKYFASFRHMVLPLVHSPKTVAQLLQERTESERIQFFGEVWNTRQWRTLFQIFFSRYLMGLLGRDPAFFKYVNANVAEFLLKTTEYALTRLSPAANPYLHWILTGTYGNSLPLNLRPENFELIRANLHRLEWRQQSLEEFAERADANSINSFNLSDVFEYMSAQSYEMMLRRLLTCADKGARLVYWNMLAARQRPEQMNDRLLPLDRLATDLFRQNKTFFYSRFLIEEVA